jgi:pimeloyl-ACP methyl ester carboxylesterase
MKMVGDVAVVMKAARVGHAFIMGYSMGGYMTARLLKEHGSLARRAVVAGVGDVYFKRSDEWRVLIADAIVSPPDADLKTAEERLFQAFANQPGKDAVALSACMRSPRQVLTPEELHRIKTPVLVVCGGEDTVSGPPEQLAEAFAHGRAGVIPGRDHMLTVGDKLYKKAVLEFLSE